MNAPGDTAKHFADLRERLGLYEQVPRIEEAHPVALEPFGDRRLILCCHDGANDDVYHVVYEPPENMDFLALLQKDGTVPPDMLLQLQNALSAAYN